MNDKLDLDASHYMHLLMDRVPSMLAYWDRDLRCRFANRAYESWFGVNPDHLLGISIQELLGPELFRLNEPHMRKALAGERQVFERLIPGPGGVVRNSLAEYIPDEVDGVVKGFLVQVTNVTELKKAQAALGKEHELRLQIEQQLAQLQSLLAERTEMLQILAHEVRQPLSNAGAALQTAMLALRGPGGGTASDQVHRAQTALGQVLTSIDNTLAVASLLARPDPIQLDDTDIETLIEVVIADMPIAERPRIRIDRQTATRTALMDMNLMRLALRNVVFNALKFSPPGSEVWLRISDSDAPLALLIDVEDHGPGVPPALLPRLFLRGSRGDQRRRGHGLGLYIVRRVLSLHGGTAELVRTGPDGSTFRLVIAQSEQETG